MLALALPIGISFYTFHLISYVVDVYRRVSTAQRNVVQFACYITLFPQLVAGPIVRYHEIETQLRDVRQRRFADFADGCPASATASSRRSSSRTPWRRWPTPRSPPAAGS